MIAVTIIVIVLICIFAYKAQVASDKKIDVVDANQRENAIQHLQPVKYNFREKSKLENVLRTLNTLDDNPISIFSYSDKFLFVKYKDGKNFTANLDQMEVLFRFGAGTNSRSAEITLGANMFSIIEDRDDDMTESKWDTIFDILQCAKITHHREILTKESREKAIHDYQLAKAISRTNRNIQRMNRF